MGMESSFHQVQITHEASVRNSNQSRRGRIRSVQVKKKTSNNGGGAGKRAKMRGPRGERQGPMRCRRFVEDSGDSFWLCYFGMPRYDSGEKGFPYFVLFSPDTVPCKFDR
jgi:hypothetical protein